MSRPQLDTYLSLCTEYYDLDKSDDFDTREGIAFYLAYASDAKGSVLEPMCGTGRFLIPLLQAGIDIEGFDASPHMLAALQCKYRQLHSQLAPVWQEFVQDFVRDKEYNLIFVPFGSWGLITNPEDSREGLNRMYQHLALGGKLILEIETVTSVPVCGVWNRDVRTRKDGSYLAINTCSSYDENTQMFHAICRYESIVNSVIETIEVEDFRMYLYRKDEMYMLLKDIGFSDIIMYQDRHKKLVDEKEVPLIIYECKK